MAEISKTADQALLVLDHVAEHGPEPTAVIARRLKLHRTVVHRLLATLHGRGFLRRVPGGFAPGLALLRIAQHVEPELLASARPILERLAREHGETFILTVADGEEAVQVEQSVGNRHFVRVQLTRGFRHPLALGASGRAILAFLAPEAAARIAARADEPKKIATQLADVRRLGYAVSHDELSFSVHGVSAPILLRGEAIASLGVVMPSVRAERVTEYGRILKRAAAGITRELART